MISPLCVLPQNIDMNPSQCMSESLRRLSVVVNSVLVPCALMTAKSNCVCCWIVTSARPVRGRMTSTTASAVMERNGIVRMARIWLFSCAGSALGHS